MPSSIKISTSFSKRQLDLECLETMDKPYDTFIELETSATFDVPRVVSGPQKLAQRYVVLFTTIIGSDRLRSDFGTTLLRVVETGNVNSEAELKLMASVANSMTMNAIRADDADAEYGPQPDDEKLLRSYIDDVVVDRETRDVRIYVSLITVAGEDITFIVPTKAGIY